VQDGQLVINPKEAKLVRHIYNLYLKLKSERLLKQDLDGRGIVSKVRISKTGISSGGKSFSRGALYELLANPLCLGEIRHKKLRYPGPTPGYRRARELGTAPAVPSRPSRPPCLIEEQRRYEHSDR
jgi:hypothetical protein